MHRSIDTVLDHMSIQPGLNSVCLDEIGGLCSSRLSHYFIKVQYEKIRRHFKLYLDKGRNFSNKTTRYRDCVALQ